MRPTFFLTGAALALAACGGSDEAVFTGPTSSVALLGPGVSLGEAATREDALEARVNDAFAEAGAFPFANLPADGTATYNGIVGGRNAGGSEAYFADLQLIVDFATDGVGGSVSNINTNISGWNALSGSIPLTGGIAEDGGDTRLTYSGNTTTVGGIGFAQLSINGSGEIGGQGGDVARGTASLNFWDVLGIFLIPAVDMVGSWNAE